ncbi:MAG: aryl-sulfate sulfotransferase [Deltaproteobacteria bacterium]|nr:aryl-sulfate sulfotransferase [Deltaproteobacteria bacterium]
MRLQLAAAVFLLAACSGGRAGSTSGSASSTSSGSSSGSGSASSSSGSSTGSSGSSGGLTLVDCDVDGGPACAGPVASFNGANVAQDPNDTLAAEVYGLASGAASVTVLYQLDGGPVEQTPAFQPSVRPLPVLGLQASSRYAMQVLATADDGSVGRSPILQLSSGVLPAAADPSFSVTATGAYQPGYVLIGKLPLNPTQSSTAGVVVDRSGRVVWYAECPTSLYGDFEKQLDHSYSLGCFTATSTFLASITTVWQVVDPLSQVTGYFTVPDNDGGTDNHEFSYLPDHDVLMIGETGQQLDTTAYGGQPNTTVVEQTLWRIHPDGGVVFFWNAFDHTDLGNVSPVYGSVGNNPLDASHINAFSQAADGNYLVSLREMNQVMKIDASTGAVIWTLGAAGDFTFLSDPLLGFSGQHDVREVAPDDLLFFDDGDAHTPPQSRAVEYKLSFKPDGGPDAATLIWSYQPPPASSGTPQFAFALGSTQRLPNGDTLVCSGTLSRVDEVDPMGNVVWSLVDTEPGFGFFRARWLDTLY